MSWRVLWYIALFELCQALWKACTHAADLPVVQDSLLTEPITSPPQQQKKKKGGARAIVMQPPVFLLFDDPAASQQGTDEPYIVSGRPAIIKYASQHSQHL